MPRTIHCPHCDALIDPMANFCDQCSTPLSGVAARTQILETRTQEKGSAWPIVAIGLMIALVIGAVVGRNMFNAPSASLVAINTPTPIDGIPTVNPQQTDQAIQAATIQAEAIATAQMQAESTVQSLHAEGTAQAQLSGTVQSAQQTATSSILQSTQTAQTLQAAQASTTALAVQAQMVANATAQSQQATAVTATPLPEVLKIVSVTASSFSNDPNYIINNRNDYGWSSASGETIGAWIQLTLSMPQTVTSIGFYTDAGNYNPRDIHLVFSDGTVQKIQLKTVSGWQNYELSPVSTSTVRIIVDSMSDRKASFVFLAEVKIFGM